VERVLDISAGRVFYDGLFAEPMLDHPEGLAVHRDGRVWCGGERGQVYRIEADGSAMEQIAQAEEGFSPGMAFDAEGNLYVACYEPSQVIRVTPDGTVECLIRDEEAHLLCHPPTWPSGTTSCSKPTWDAGT
jgi:sugar lactone lactonase YvrE